MKKILCLILGCLFTLFSVGCGNESTNLPSKSTSKSTTESISKGVIDDATKYYKIGDTVSTDIIKFTLDKAKFAIALCDDGVFNSDGSIEYDENYFAPEEYDSKKHSESGSFVAPMGHTYACYSYTLENINRATMVFNSFEENGDLEEIITVEYKGKKYSEAETGAIYYYEPYTYLDPNYKQHRKEALKWYKKDISGASFTPGEKRSFRAYTDVSVNVTNLSESFVLIIKLPDSSGKSVEFRYKV